jgi:hypothetical protein
MYVCLSIFLSNSKPINLSACLSACLSIFLSLCVLNGLVCLSACMSTLCLSGLSSARLHFVSQSVCLSASLCLFVSQSLSLSACLCLFPVCQSGCPLYQSACMSLFVSPSLTLSVCLCPCPCVCLLSVFFGLYVCLSVCLLCVRLSVCLQCFCLSVFNVSVCLSVQRFPPYLIFLPRKHGNFCEKQNEGSRS